LNGARRGDAADDNHTHCELDDTQIVPLRVVIEWSNIWMIAIYVQLAMVFKGSELRVVAEGLFPGVVAVRILYRMIHVQVGFGIVPMVVVLRMIELRMLMASETIRNKSRIPWTFADHTASFVLMFLF
jgi:hypothetical protein